MAGLSRAAVEIMLEEGLSSNDMRTVMSNEGMSDEDIKRVLVDLPSYNAYSQWLTLTGTVEP